MEVKPRYETFGREVPFEDIHSISRVTQPGILHRSEMFDRVGLELVLREFFLPDEKLMVYFRNLAGTFLPDSKDLKRKWWDNIREFRERLGFFSAGAEMEYWYDPDSQPHSSVEFMENGKLPYQAFLRLFDNALQGFSCFVNGSEEGISFKSNRTNYKNIKPGEFLISDENTFWSGTRDEISVAFSAIQDAFYQMNLRGLRGQGIVGYNGQPAEVRIIAPTCGRAVVSRLVGDNSVSLYINSNVLQEIVEKHDARKVTYTRRI